MGKRQEELEVCVQSQGFDLTAVTETWWDSSHDWNAVMKGYMMFRRERAGRHGGRVTLCVIQHLKIIELCPGVNDE